MKSKLKDGTIKGSIIGWTSAKKKSNQGRKIPGPSFSVVDITIGSGEFFLWAPKV